jgi:hypothetical protein
MDVHLDSYANNGELVSKVEEIKSYKLNCKVGENLAKSEIILCAYDESINSFLGFEGITYLTSH